MNNNRFDQEKRDGCDAFALIVISLYALIAGVIVLVQKIAALVAGGG